MRGAVSQLVIGKGEIGTAMYNVLNEVYDDVFVRDVEEIDLYEVDVLHICLPELPNFKEVVEDYIDQYNPELVIVHSTVPVGTCDSLGVVHSPVRGIHPNLEKGIKTFTKYFGGKDAKKASKIFKPITEVKVVKEAKTTELAKILSTTYYGWNIIFQKEAKKLADEYGADFDISYTDWNETYNQGYAVLGRHDVIRPVLKHVEGKIGGHCVVQNCDLLDTAVTKIIKTLNETYEI